MNDNKSRGPIWEKEKDNGILIEGLKNIIKDKDKQIVDLQTDTNNLYNKIKELRLANDNANSLISAAADEAMKLTEKIKNLQFNMATDNDIRVKNIRFECEKKISDLILNNKNLFESLKRLKKHNKENYLAANAIRKELKATQSRMTKKDKRIKLLEFLIDEVLQTQNITIGCRDDLRNAIRPNSPRKF